MVDPDHRIEWQEDIPGTMDKSDSLIKTLQQENEEF